MREPDFNIVILGSRRSDPETLQLVAENFRSKGFRIEEHGPQLAAWWPDSRTAMTQEMAADIRRRFLEAQGKPPQVLIDEYQVFGIAAGNLWAEIAKTLHLEQICAWLDKQIRKVWK